MIATTFLHYEIDAGPNNVIQVIFDLPWVNVLLLDEFNYQNYSKGKPYSYHGGLAESSPFSLRAPINNHWHLVVNRGGELVTGNISVKVI